MNNLFLTYSVGGTYINKDWFGMPMDQVWGIMEDYLYFIAYSYDVRVHSFVLMSNHYHMLISADEGQLSPAMQYLHSQTGREIAKCAGRIHHTWRARFFRSKISTTHYFNHAYKYFYRNPVEAKICSTVEDYRYSTLHGLLGLSKLIIPIEYDHILFNDMEGTLKWLNEAPQEKHREAVKKALKRKVFDFPRGKGKKRKHELDTEEY